MSTTTNLSLNEPAYNSSSPTWDQPLNYNSTILDAVLGNTTSVAMPTGASATTTLTGPTSTGTGQTQAMRIQLTGALSANQILQFPAGVSGKWIIYNTTSNAFTITVSSAGGGATVTAPQGFNIQIYSDGTNIRYTDDGLSNNFSTLTVLGNTYLATTSGNVGIGTTSPVAKLHLLTPSATNVELRLANNQSYGSIIENSVGEMQFYTPGTAMTFSTNSTERMRIDTSGNLLVGTTTSPSGSGNLVVPQVYTGTSATAANVYVDSTGKFFRSTASAVAIGTTWTNYTSSRALGTTYTNSTGKLIFLSVATTSQVSSISIAVNGVTIFSNSWGGSAFNTTAFTAIPPGATYSVSSPSSGGIQFWYECV